MISLRYFPLVILAVLQISRVAADVVVIDAGHGGRADSGSQAERTLSSSNNAESSRGLLEKDLTLELSREILAQFEKSEEAKRADLKALPTRTMDTNPDFAMRTKIAVDGGAKWFVSIHFNAVPKGARKASGTVALVQQKSQNPNYTNDVALGSTLVEAVNRVIKRHLPESKAFPVQDDSNMHDGKGSNLFHQLRRQCPGVSACFLEVEFIDNPVVEQALLGKARPQIFAEVAAAIVQALVAKCAPAAKQQVPAGR